MLQRVLSIPNILTLLRILMTPVIVYMVLTQQAWWAVILMLVAGITDMLDGAIARYFNQRTTVGAYLDPLADKILLVSLFVSLFFVGKVPLFIFLAVIFRDAIIIFGAIAYEMVTRQLTIEPSLISKATTFMQIFYVCLLLLNMAMPTPPILMVTVMWATFALTCMSGVHYMVIWTHKAAGHERAQ
ncbi:MAG: CDP-alcohol phosphatidyltransferase family protein [Mariprofundaceae bacterium]|nr:CDP-alcohol phosphatidyltransferase family protein [Mariprofundaceae bacterium]